MFLVNASKIRTLMFDKGIAGSYELARKAKLNGATIRNCLQDGARATLKTIAALANFFGVNGEELILKEEVSV